MILKGCKTSLANLVVEPLGGTRADISGQNALGALVRVLPRVRTPRSADISALLPTCRHRAGPGLEAGVASRIPSVRLDLALFGFCNRIRFLA